MGLESANICALENKLQLCENRNYYFEYIFSNILKLYPSSSSIISSSLACLSPVFSVLLKALLIAVKYYYKQQIITMNYFCQNILGLIGTMSSWLKINRQGGGLQNEYPGMHFLKM